MRLPWVYQAMDYLDAATINRVCRMSHEAAETLLAGPVDILFYDCTTLAFDTDREDPEDASDRLLAKGYSKDGKSHRSQVVLALMVTTDGLPVGYDLFPGNMWEGHTLETAIKGLEERYRLGKITLVADAGMLSADNQDMLRTKGLPFILGYRLKSAPAGVKDKALDTGGYKPWAGHGAAEGAAEAGRYKVIDHDGARGSSSPSRPPAPARMPTSARRLLIVCKPSFGAPGAPPVSATGDMPASSRFQRRERSHLIRTRSTRRPNGTGCTPLLSMAGTISHPRRPSPNITSSGRSKPASAPTSMT